MAQARLTQLAGFIDAKHKVQTWDPDASSFPMRKDLPSIPGAPEGAAWFWGKDDYVSATQLRR